MKSYTVEHLELFYLLYLKVSNPHTETIHILRQYKNLAIANRSRVSCAHPVTLKSRLRVTQGHCKRNHWTDHTRLSSNRVIWRWIISWPWNLA